VIVEIEDQGVSMPDERRHALNLRLSNPAVHQASSPLQADQMGQMGMWVVAEYTNWLGLRVALEPGPHGGNLARVLIPQGLFEPRQGAGRRPMAAPLPTETTSAVPAAAQPLQRRQRQHAVGTGVGMPPGREAGSSQKPVSSITPSGPSPSGSEAPALPVRRTGVSYLATGLQRPAAAPGPPSKQAHNPTVLAEFAQGRQSADADRLSERTTHAPEDPAPRPSGDTDGIHEHQ
jgi:hypothetical protein